jgi:hypothetical protein
VSFDFIYPTPLPSTKGWGPGWPNCQREAMVTVPPFVGGFHRDIAELMGLLVAEMRRRGFVFLEPGCWGFGCRATKGGGGDVPSFHSWGLAADINAPLNVFGAPEETSQIATTHRWVVPLMATYGFFWLGPTIKDWMHFSFVGSPQDAAAMTVKARRELGDVGYAEFEKGLRLRRQGKPLPTDATADTRLGFDLVRDIERAAQTPAPGTPGPHEHSLEGKAK